MQRVDISLWKDNLANFADLAMRKCEGMRLASKWHIGYLSEILTAVKNRELRNINIVIPPGHTKTFLVLKAFVPWLLGHDPSTRVIYVRRKVTLAEDEVSKSKDLMLSNVYKAIFPNISLAKKGDSKFTIANHRGYVEARGVEGAITGAHAELLICDDIIDAKDSQAVSEKICKDISSFFTRLRDNEKQENYGIIFINQRISLYDQTDFLRKNYSNFTEFVIPFIEEQDKTYSFGKFTYKRPANEVVNPGLTTIEKVKGKIGDWEKSPSVMAVYQTQYQQNPQVNLDGVLWGLSDIQRSHINVYNNLPQEEIKNRMQRTVIGVDPAVSTEKNSDLTGIVVCGYDGIHYYVLEDASGKYTPDQWASKVEYMWNKWEADMVIAERNQGGDLVKNILLKQKTAMLITDIHARKGKITRAEPIVALYEKGLVKHIQHTKEQVKDNYLAKLEYEMLYYVPHTTENSPDRMDAMVYAMTFLSTKVNNNLSLDIIKNSISY